MPVVINYWAVLVAAIANMIVGGIWYAPGVFGATWMKLLGKTPEDMKQGMGPAVAMSWMFVGALVMSYVMAYFTYYVGATTIGDGLQLGFWVWLGFVATTMIGSVLFEQRPMKLFWINSLNMLVTLLLMGAILAAWR